MTFVQRVQHEHWSFRVELSVHGKWIGHFLTLGRLLVSIGVDLGQEGLSTLNIDFLTTNITSTLSFFSSPLLCGLGCLFINKL